MRSLVILLIASLFLVECKKPFEFNHKYYLVQNELSHPVCAFALDSNEHFVSIGHGDELLYPANLTSDSINFCLPCAGRRHSYSSNADTMFIHSIYGTVKISPIDSVNQEILFANELIKMEIEEGKGNLKSLQDKLRAEVKIGYSLRDSIDDFQLQINDDVIEFDELHLFQDEVSTYSEPLDIILYFHREYPEESRDDLIRELKTDQSVTLYQAFYDTTDIDFISYSRIR